MMLVTSKVEHHEGMELGFHVDRHPARIDTAHALVSLVLHSEDTYRTNARALAIYFIVVSSEKIAVPARVHANVDLCKLDTCQRARV
jgi:hypothetical protein